MLGISLSLWNSPAVYSGATVSPVTFNTADPNAASTFSNGNMTVTLNGANLTGSRTTRGISSGKIFVEYHLDSMGSGCDIGIADGAAAATIYANDIGASGDLHGITFGALGALNYNGTTTGGGPSFATGDYIGLAIDATAQKVWLYQNGVLKTTGDPVAGTGGQSFSAVTGPYYPVVQAVSAALGVTLNAGATAYSFSVPTGYGPIP